MTLRFMTGPVLVAAVGKIAIEGALLDAKPVRTLPSPWFDIISVALLFSAPLLKPGNNPLAFTELYSASIGA